MPDTLFSIIRRQIYSTFWLRERFDHNDYESKQMQQYVYDCDLLIVDDLGTELLPMHLSASQFFTCINERLLNMKSTVVSTNLSLDSLADLYTERSFHESPVTISC